MENLKLEAVRARARRMEAVAQATQKAGAGARGDEIMRLAAVRALALIQDRLQCDYQTAVEYLQSRNPALAWYIKREGE